MTVASDGQKAAGTNEERKERIVLHSVAAGEHKAGHDLQACDAAVNRGGMAPGVGLHHHQQILGG